MTPTAMLVDFVAAQNMFELKQSLVKKYGPVIISRPQSFTNQHWPALATIICDPVRSVCHPL